MKMNLTVNTIFALFYDKIMKMLSVITNSANYYFMFKQALLSPQNIDFLNFCLQNIS